jgi:hypothetical protein
MIDIIRAMLTKNLMTGKQEAKLANLLIAKQTFMGWIHNYVYWTT